MKAIKNRVKIKIMVKKMLIWTM